MIAAVFKSVEQRPAGERLSAAVSRATEMRAVEWVLALAANPEASAEARAAARSYAIGLKNIPIPSPTAAELSLHDAIAARVGDV